MSYGSPIPNGQTPRPSSTSLRCVRTRRSVARIATLVLLLVVLSAAPNAHDVVPDPFVAVTIQNQAGQVSVTVTLPMLALDDARLPRREDRRLDREASLQALQLVGRDLANSMEFRQGDESLSPGSIEASISPDETDVQIVLVYRTRDGLDGLSARLSPYRSGLQTIPLVVRYGPSPESARTFRIESQPERIEFEPTLPAAARQFVTRGIRALLGSNDAFLALICLFVPRRRIGALPAAAAALLVGEGTTAVLFGSGIWPGGAQAASVGQILAASALVVMALQAIVNSGSRWVWPVAGLFGLSHGVALGDMFLTQASFAGVHAGTALGVFLVVVGFGQAWIMAIIASGIALLYRQGLPERLASVGVSVLVVHTALHLVDERSAILATPTMTAADLLIRLALGWGLVVLAAGIVETLWLSRMRPLSPIDNSPAEAAS